MFVLIDTIRKKQSLTTAPLLPNGGVPIADFITVRRCVHFDSFSMEKVSYQRVCSSPNRLSNYSAIIQRLSNGYSTVSLSPEELIEIRNKMIFTELFLIEERSSSTDDRGSRLVERRWQLAGKRRRSEQTE